MRLVIVIWAIVLAVILSQTSAENSQHKSAESNSPDERFLNDDLHNMRLLSDLHKDGRDEHFGTRKRNKEKSEKGIKMAKWKLHKDNRINYDRNKGKKVDPGLEQTSVKQKKLEAMNKLKSSLSKTAHIANTIKMEIESNQDVDKYYKLTVEQYLQQQKEYLKKKIISKYRNYAQDLDRATLKSIQKTTDLAKHVLKKFQWLEKQLNNALKKLHTQKGTAKVDNGQYTVTPSSTSTGLPDKYTKKTKPPLFKDKGLPDKNTKKMKPTLFKDKGKSGQYTVTPSSTSTGLPDMTKKTKSPLFKDKGLPDKNTKKMKPTLFKDEGKSDRKQQKSSLLKDKNISGSHAKEQKDKKRPGLQRDKNKSVNTPQTDVDKAYAKLGSMIQTFRTRSYKIAHAKIKDEQVKKAFLYRLDQLQKKMEEPLDAYQFYVSIRTEASLKHLESVNKKVAGIITELDGLFMAVKNAVALQKTEKIGQGTAEELKRWLIKQIEKNEADEDKTEEGKHTKSPILQKILQDVLKTQLTIRQHQKVFIGIILSIVIIIILYAAYMFHKSFRSNRANKLDDIESNVSGDTYVSKRQSTNVDQQPLTQPRNTQSHRQARNNRMYGNENGAYGYAEMDGYTTQPMRTPVKSSPSAQEIDRRFSNLTQSTITPNDSVSQQDLRRFNYGAKHY